MFGFRKKKKIQKKEEKSTSRIHVIPDIFYGGKDPVIYHKQKVEVTTQKKHTEKKQAQQHIVQDSFFHTHKKLIVIGGIVLLLGVTSVSAWYYIGTVGGQTSNKVVVVPPKQVSEPVEDPAKEEVPVEEPIVEEDSIPEEEPIFPTTTPEVIVEDVDIEIEPVSFPRILLIDSPDADADELTDEEEIIFSTNVDVWDTDNDGYYDGQEVINLYNPNGLAPVKIIDSGLVEEYTNPVWKYRLYYPNQWKLGEVDTESRQVLISTLSGDFIEVRTFDKQKGMSFQQWFSQNIEGEKFQDIRIEKNRFKEDGWRRKDGLVAYFVSDVYVSVLIYHPGVTGAVPYRNVMRMVFESFRSAKNAVVIPDQAVLPTPPTFGTSSVDTSAVSDTATSS